MGSVQVFLLGTFLVVAMAPTSMALGFTCNSTGATCQALVGYKAPNRTTISVIQALFNVTDLLSILGANNLPISTPLTYSVEQNRTIWIPFPCSCSNGTGISRNTPQYTVLSGDGLYHIAAEVFSNVVKYPDIMTVNNITDENKILVGQKLWIPLPCSCDEVDGKKVVHYAHVVAAGCTVDAISQEFNVSADVLMSLNHLSKASDLMADVAFDVPLTACSSMIRNDSLDSSLLVAGGTYVVTANDCVKCSCAAGINSTLQCQPSALTPSNWSVCPSMQCEGSGLTLGNTTTTNSCNTTTCSYAGYTNQTIFTMLDTKSTCPAGRNYSTKIGLGAFSWNILVTLILAMLSLQHLQ